LFDRRRREFRYFAIALVILAALVIVQLLARSWVCPSGAQRGRGFTAARD